MPGNLQLALGNAPIIYMWVVHLSACANHKPTRQQATYIWQVPLNSGEKNPERMKEKGKEVTPEGRKK